MLPDEPVVPKLRVTTLTGVLPLICLESEIAQRGERVTILLNNDISVYLNRQIYPMGSLLHAGMVQIPIGSRA